MGEPGPDGLIVSLSSYSNYIVLLETQKCTGFRFYIPAAF